MGIVNKDGEWTEFNSEALGLDSPSPAEQRGTTVLLEAGKNLSYGR